MNVANTSGKKQRIKFNRLKSLYSLIMDGMISIQDIWHESPPPPPPQPHVALIITTGGIPHTRRTECAKIKISQSDFNNLKFGKKVNIPGTGILILAEYKNDRNMQNFQIVIDRRKIGTNFTFQGFRSERSKILLHLIHFN